MLCQAITVLFVEWEAMEWKLAGGGHDGHVGSLS